MKSNYKKEKEHGLLHPLQFQPSNILKLQKKHLPLILQLGFLGIGALLILAFTFLYSDQPQKADALLFSPVSQTNEDNVKKDYQYKLLFADQKKLIYKETSGDTQTIKLVNLGTNLTTNIASGKRLGFIGLLDEATLLFLDDKDGLGRFTVNRFNLDDKTTDLFLAFLAPKTLSSTQLDNLVSISPDKTQLLITHESGIVLYTIKSENEITILGNSSADNCDASQSCLSYDNPRWITNSQLLVNQLAINNSTPLIIDSKGTIVAVLPANMTDFSMSVNGYPLVGRTAEGISLVEPKKTTPVLKGDAYYQPRWLGIYIVAINQSPDLLSLVRTDKTGKKLVTLEEFPNNNFLGDLITDPKHENIYFLTVNKEDSNISAIFYKMGQKETKPVSVYSISKNL